MYALIQSKIVVQISSDEFPVSPELTWMIAPVGCAVGWILVGDTLYPPPPPRGKTVDEMRLGLNQAMEVYIDEGAAERSYQSAVYCISYLSSVNARWASDAKSVLVWRDACWEYAYPIIDSVTAKSDYDEMLASMLESAPVLKWS